MPYVRISLMTPKMGQATEAGRLLDAVAHFCQGQEGFIHGYRLEPSAKNGQMGRVTIWVDERSADAVAQIDHMLALRSELNQVVRKGSHEEHGFWAYDTSEPSEATGRGRDEEITSEQALASAEEIIRSSQSDA
jgi:hypothetical protein